MRTVSGIYFRFRKNQFTPEFMTKDIRYGIARAALLQSNIINEPTLPKMLHLCYCITPTLLSLPLSSASRFCSSRVRASIEERR